MKDALRELVRKTIEETINAMLDEEADQLVGAAPYERTDESAPLTAPATTSAASPRRLARSRSRCPSSRG